MANPEPTGSFEFRLELEIFGRSLSARGRTTTASIRIADFLPVVNSVSGAVERATEEKLAEEGREFSCRAGCAACCRQPVPIGEAEAIRLAELVEAMPENRRTRIRRRFERALEKLEENGLLDRLRKLPELRSPAARQAFGLQYFWLHIPCPFLRDEQCTIREDRPLACREYLVTSPAEFCDDPNPEEVEMVKLPVKLSSLLFRMGDGKGEDKVRWLPMLLALEWAEEHRGEPPRTYPGKQLCDSLLSRLAERLEDSGSEK